MTTEAWIRALTSSDIDHRKRTTRSTCEACSGVDTCKTIRFRRRFGTGQKSRVGIARRCLACGDPAIDLLEVEKADKDEDDDRDNYSSSSDGKESNTGKSTVCVRILNAKGFRAACASVGMWRSYGASVKIPEFGLEWIRRRPRPGLAGSFVSFKSIMQTMQGDLRGKSAAFDRAIAYMNTTSKERADQALEEDEVPSFVLVVEDKTGISRVTYLEDAVPPGVVVEGPQESLAQSIHSVDRMEEDEGVTVAAGSIVEDERQAELLAQFVRLANREASSTTATPSAGDRVVVFWPPEAAYYPARVLDLAADESTVSVLYDTGEFECGVALDRVRGDAAS